jgi:predicted RNA binding protein YcfA (HicA-like mRNA interferase family)
MRRLPAITAPQMLSVLERARFVITRSKGGHHFLQRNSISRIVITAHPGNLPKGTVRDILKQAKISKGEFLGLL